jgi:mannan endo-1,4-beta-mannosidase
MYNLLRSIFELLRKTFIRTFSVILFLSSDMIYGQIDPNATSETKALYKNLKSIGATGSLFGHQDAPAYGLNLDGTRWVADESRSDIKTILGEQPALLGFDLGHLELGKFANLDDVPFNKIKQYIEEQ